jgi:hypothetical protein
VCVIRASGVKGWEAGDVATRTTCRLGGRTYVGDRGTGPLFITATGKRWQRAHPSAHGSPAVLTILPLRCGDEGVPILHFGYCQDVAGRIYSGVGQQTLYEKEDNVAKANHDLCGSGGGPRSAAGICQFGGISEPCEKRGCGYGNGQVTADVLKSDTAQLATTIGDLMQFETFGQSVERT